jgi:hypothetical protein
MRAEIILASLTTILWGLARSKIVEMEVPVNRFDKTRHMYLSKFKFYNGGHMYLDLKLLKANAGENGVAVVQLAMLNYADYKNYMAKDWCQGEDGSTRDTVDLDIPVNGTDSFK